MNKRPLALDHPGLCVTDYGDMGNVQTYICHVISLYLIHMWCYNVYVIRCVLYHGAISDVCHLPFTEATLIRHRADTSTSGWCLTYVDPRAFAPWDIFAVLLTLMMAKSICQSGYHVFDVLMCVIKFIIYTYHTWVCINIKIMENSITKIKCL